MNIKRIFDIFSSEKALAILCWGLFLLHSGWVCVHAYYHSQDMLNPWKLGGYAMYTRPTPRFYSDVYYLDDNGEILSERLIQIKSFGRYAKGGCLSGVDKRFYKTFIRKNVEYLSNGQVIRTQFHFRSEDLLKPYIHINDMGYADIRYREDQGLYQVDEVFCDKKKSYSFQPQAVK